jgi:hypothetical protein
VALAILLWSLGLPGWLQRTEAAALTNFSDTLSDSDLGVVSNHLFAFDTEFGMSEGEILQITFPAGFDLTSIDTEIDIDIATGTDLTTTGNPCSAGTEQVSATTSGQLLTFEICTGDGGTIASSSSMTIEIGTNATSSGTGLNRITNPSSAGSYAIDIAGTMTDIGQTRVAIIDNVTVSAAVDTTFTFTISDVGASTTINDESQSTTGTTTATTVPFGTLTPDTEYFLGQELGVSTNASNGFTVTVEADTTLTSGGGADIDAFIDGAETGSSTPWVAPAGTFGTEDTYGHWGLTSDDDDVGSSTLSYGASATYYVGNFINNNPIPVMYHPTSVNGTGQGQGTTTVGYKIRISSLQEAGSDYTAELTYIATPVF